MTNRRFTQALLGAVVVLALAALMLFPVGCSRLVPTSPESQPEGFRAEDLWPAPPYNLMPWPKTCSAADSGLFSREGGGSFDLEAECFSVGFNVPAGALRNDVVISVRTALFNYWGDGELQKGLDFDFTPEGLAFERPAQVEFEAAVLGADDGETVRLYWYNPGTGLWEVQQEVKVKGEKVEMVFYVHHFSRYAISE
jgi:hypothetical protein